MEQGRNRGTILKLALFWLAILLLGSFWLTTRVASGPVSMSVIPQVPREGEPVIAIVKLNNPLSHALVIRYQFHTNGKLLNEGVTTIPAASSKTYQYAYKNHLQLGEQLNFVVRTQSERGNHEVILSSPSYPPQIWSSFVSFASFSTSVMSSISTMTYYQSTFGGSIGLDIGIIATTVLIALLIFLELTQPVLQKQPIVSLGRLRLRLSTVTWILFIIFIAMLYTKVVMVLVVS